MPVRHTCGKANANESRFGKERRARVDEPAAACAARAATMAAEGPPACVRFTGESELAVRVSVMSAGGARWTRPGTLLGARSAKRRDLAAIAGLELHAASARAGLRHGEQLGMGEQVAGFDGTSRAAA